MDVTEKEDERLEETLKDVKRKWPYYSAFCLQYTPRDCHHEEKIVLRKILWALASKTAQGCMLLRKIKDTFIPEYGFKPSEVNFQPILTAVGSVAFVTINLWYLCHL